MMVDMATPYEEIPIRDSEFGQMRDSLYILGVMNQCRSPVRSEPIDFELKE